MFRRVMSLCPGFMESIHVKFVDSVRSGRCPEPYDEKGVEYFHSRDPDLVESQLVKRLKHLGYQVIAPPAA